MVLKEYASQIQKTGFALEFRVSELLRQHGWNVIHNKYYVDDQSGVAREMDLVAYKARLVQHFRIYTTLIVSCKKDEKNVWAFLTKARDPKDPNAEWQPLHVWSNDRALEFMIRETPWRNRYLPIPQALRAPDYGVFGFQELNKTSGTPQNDTHMFQSVSSLVKAQAYEFGSLPNRKKTVTLYQFNLLSVVDAGLVRLHFDGSDVVPSHTDEFVYIANYIVKNRETTARVHVADLKAFERVLADYDELHVVNSDFFDDLCNEFYATAAQDAKRLQVFRKDLASKLKWLVQFTAEKLGRQFECRDVVPSWNRTTKRLELEVPAEDDILAALNEDKNLRAATDDALRGLYRYEGTWAYVADTFGDIPF